jgi:rare lipoprotein A
MKYSSLIQIFMVVLFFLFMSTGCAQSKNMTRNDTVIDEQPIDDTSDFGSTAVGDTAADSSDFGADNGWGNDEVADTATSNDDGYIVGAAGGAATADATGNCSWYGREFHGRKTASGETFDMYALSAAHRTYPFGTLLKVTNLDNGKSVQVKVNDRGPYKDDRILDVSYAAGRELGMLAKGVAPVSIQILSMPTGNSTVPASGYSDSVVDPYDEPYTPVATDPAPVVNSGAYALQCGAFYSKVNADSLREKLEGMFQNPVVVVKENDLYKVRILNISTKGEASQYKQILAGENIPGYLIEN